MMRELLLAAILAVGCQTGATTALTDEEREWCRENDGRVYAVLTGALSSTTPDGEPMLNWFEDAALLQWIVGGEFEAAEGDARYRAACRQAFAAEN